MAVYLVDTCNAYRVSMESTDAGFQPLGNYFGSVGGGAAPMFQALTVRHSAAIRPPFGRHSEIFPCRYADVMAGTDWWIRLGFCDVTFVGTSPASVRLCCCGCCAGYSTFLGILQSEACNCGGSMVCLFFLRSFVDSHVSVASVFSSC